MRACLALLSLEPGCGVGGAKAGRLLVVRQELFRTAFSGAEPRHCAFRAVLSHSLSTESLVCLSDGIRVLELISCILSYFLA